MAHAISTQTGLTQWRQGPAVTSGILEGVMRYLAQRRTQRALASLDDRMLEDIGLSRGDIHSAAVQASGGSAHVLVPDSDTWLTRLLRAQARARMVRELRNLPDHILDDIGVQRGLIEESVYRVTAETRVEVRSSAAAPVHTSPVHGLLHRVEAAAWPFRRRHSGHAESRKVDDMKSAANRNEAHANVA